MNLKTIIVSVFALCLFAGCAAPQAHLIVPDGWQATSIHDLESGFSQTLANEGEQAYIFVKIAPDKTYPRVKEQLDSDLRYIKSVGGKLIESLVVADQSFARLAFTIELADGTLGIGRIILRKSTKGKRTVAVRGVWPLDKDAVIRPDFEAIAASVDYK
ncbi:MAG: hypothetical protein WCT10_03020 [Patescibacteria group bacterium]|jgi:hypothetical protein